MRRQLYEHLRLAKYQCSNSILFDAHINNEKDEKIQIVFCTLIYVHWKSFTACCIYNLCGTALPYFERDEKRMFCVFSCSVLLIEWRFQTAQSASIRGMHHRRQEQCLLNLSLIIREQKHTSLTERKSRTAPFFSSAACSPRKADKTH